MRDYNHKAKNLSEATGLNLEKLSDEAAEQVLQWMERDDETNTSFLTKRLEDNLNIRELAVLATQHVLGSIEKAHNSPEVMQGARAMTQSEDNKS